MSGRRKWYDAGSDFRKEKSCFCPWARKANPVAGEDKPIFRSNSNRLNKGSIGRRCWEAGLEFRPAVARGARAKMGRASSLRAAGAGRPRAAGQCPVRVQSRFFTFWYFDFLCISMSFKERLSFSSELLVYFNKCRYDTSCWGTLGLEFFPLLVWILYDDL